VDTLTTNGSGKDQPLSDAEFTAQLDPLVQQWQDHEDVGLEIRHATGKLLNEYLGPPTERQPRGKATVKGVAAKLRTSLSDISRMRTFADYYKSVGDLKSNYPKETTWSWTKVKELLPKLKGATSSATTPGQAAKAKPKEAAKVKRILSTLSATIKEVVNNLTDKDKKELRKQFRDVFKAAGDCLKVQSVGKVPVESNLPAGNEEGDHGPHSLS